MTQVVIDPTAVSNNSGSTGLSSGAKTGIIVGSVIGALAILALVVVLCIAGKKKRKRDNDRADNIRWPEIVASVRLIYSFLPKSTFEIDLSTSSLTG